MAKTAPSARYGSMLGEIVNIRQALLPATFDPAGNYSPAQRISAAAFRVLAHAEIEAYVEDRALELARDSVADFKTSGRANRTIISLVAFSGQKFEGPLASLSPPAGTTPAEWRENFSLDDRLDDALATYFRVVRDNHGVKEENLIRLLIPVGVSPSALNTTWLPTMNSFGEKRGTFAHRSVSAYRATILPDPQDELATVNTITTGLADIDQVLTQLHP